MRLRDPRFKRGRIVRVAVVAGLCATVLPLTAAASGTGTPSTGGVGGFFNRLFGGGASSPSSPAPQSPGPSTNLSCPPVAIRSGGETVAVYERAGETNPLNLRYQVTIGELARECLKSDQLGTVKLGVAGRVVLGPKGAAGSYVVPVRISVMRGGTEQVYSNLIRVPVNIGQGQSSTPFTYVAEDVTFPMEADARLSNYLIYVGFDQGAPKKPR